jgi:hypothetical protein
VINNYIKENNWTFPIVMGKTPNTEYTVGKQYGVQAYPTNYLIGADGKVLWRGLGFDEKAMREALAKAGFTKSASPAAAKPASGAERTNG